MPRLSDPVKKPARNHLVLFRLSQQEFSALEAESRARGALNLSTFTRAEILDLKTPPAPRPRVAPRVAVLEEEIARLKAIICHLTEVLEGTGQ